MPSSLWGSDASSDGEDGENKVDEQREPCLPTHVQDTIRVPGAFLLRNAIPRDLHDQLLKDLVPCFKPPVANQAMVFCRPGQPFASPWLSRLVSRLKEDILLPPVVPQEVYDLLFHRSTDLAWQAILNLYRPGEGIKPHVDLARFADGILGISLGTSCVMQFTKRGQHQDQCHSNQCCSSSSSTLAVVLRPRDVYILTGEARYDWEHGIPARPRDVFVDDNNGMGEETLVRGTRFSVTLRRLCEGSDVVGE